MKNSTRSIQIQDQKWLEKNALNCFRLLVFNVPQILLFFLAREDNSRQRSHTFDSAIYDTNTHTHKHTHAQKYESIYSQHSMGFDATCKDTVLPVAWLMWTRKTILTRVFLRPISVSPFLSSMSELRSLRIPAQSILWDDTKSLNSHKHFGASSVCLGGGSEACEIYMYNTSVNTRGWSFTLGSTL